MSPQLRKQIKTLSDIRTALQSASDTAALPPHRDALLRLGADLGIVARQCRTQLDLLYWTRVETVRSD